MSKNYKTGANSEEKPRPHKREWEAEAWAQGWLIKNKRDSKQKQSFCLVCNKELRSHYSDLQKHAKTASHEKNLERIDVKQQTITNMCNINFKAEEKVRDLKLAVYIASHSSIRSADHLCFILNELKFKDMKLHRTKCSALIKHVVAPNLLLELIEDISDKSYSLIVDESTDVSTTKYLCLCVKYFSGKQNRIIIDFLGLIEIDKADAVTLYAKVTSFLRDINLPLLNLIGLGTDGGSNLCGKNNSLFALLKKDIPQLQLVRCICHSLNLAASAAAEVFPSSIEFLCRETFNWFSNSAVRRSTYRLLWNAINQIDENSNESSKDFHNFVKLSATRWLARYNVVKVLLEHYFELKTHFSIVVNTEKCYTARQLSEMLKDDANYLYLKIIKPILYEVNTVNLVFQRNMVDVSCAFDDLADLIIILARKVLQQRFMTTNFDSILRALEQDSAYLPFYEADYGIEYHNALVNIKISNEVRNVIENRAFNYIKTLCTQLISRLPENLTYFRQLKTISPTVILKQIRPKFSEMPFLKEFGQDNLGLLENQYNRLLNVNWVDILGEESVRDTYQFWSKVLIFKNAGGRMIFYELATFALKLLSLPSSNAIVERSFSIMNGIKTKSRNRMLHPLLESILRIKMHFSANNLCCEKFEPSFSMLKDFNSKIVYCDQEKTNLNENSNTFDFDQEEIEILSVLQSFDVPCISLLEN